MTLKASTKGAKAAVSEAGPGKGTETTRRAEQKPERKAMSCLDAAEAVLREKGEPMNTRALIEAIFAKGLWRTDAPTPAATLYSAILREQQRKGEQARFRKADRGLFALNATAAKAPAKGE